MSYTFRYKNYAEALYDSLREDAFYLTLEKSIEDPVSAKVAMLKYLDYSIVESEKYGEVLIPAEHKFGVSVWAKPLSEDLSIQKSEEKHAFLLQELGEKSLKMYISIVNPDLSGNFFS